MIDIKYALANQELIRWNTIVKGYDPNPFYDLEHYRTMFSLAQEHLGIMYAKRKQAPRDNIEYLRYIAGEIKDDRREIKEFEAKIDEIMRGVPNICDPDTPVTKDMTFREFLSKKGVEYIAP